MMKPARPVYSRKVRGSVEPRHSRRRVPPLAEIKLDALRLDVLRLAIRANQVTFPSPVPTFERHDRADLQWKLAQLYFVLGWDCEDIATKYGLIHQRVRQILRTWRRRAVEMGFIQLIPPADVLISMAQPAHAASRAPINERWPFLPSPAVVNTVVPPVEAREMALAESSRP